VVKEVEWLLKLVLYLLFAILVQLAIGYLVEGYFFDWLVYEWLFGENVNGTIDDLDQVVVDLVVFVSVLCWVNVIGAHWCFFYC